MTNLEELIEGPDSIEMIRAKIADIIKVQTVHQGSMAMAAGKDPCGFDVRVFMEAVNPIGSWAAADFADPRPIVNVFFESSTSVPGSSTIKDQRMKSLFHVDCYAAGVAGRDVAGFIDADTTAGIAATRVGGLCRRILFSAQFTYLDLPRTMVSGRQISTLAAFVPGTNDRAVERVRCSRLTVSVDHLDVNQQALGQPLESLLLSSLKEETGEVLYQLQFGERPEE